MRWNGAAFERVVKKTRGESQCDDDDDDDDDGHHGERPVGTSQQRGTSLIVCDEKRISSLLFSVWVKPLKERVAVSK